MDDFEKLGWFYLGRPVDPAMMTTRLEPLLYDSRDLVTHAVIVGMTGSGKTGLGIDLLEEAAIDGVPALVVDPKGDLSNLLLTFPDLRTEDFLPYVRAEEAARKGVSRDDLAEAEAKKWREGLAVWGEDGERIRKLRAAAEVALYTPGSELGRPISILASFAAPLAALRDDRELFRDRVETAATSLLSLAGIEADPLRSREHILVSTLLAEAWTAGRSYDLPSLIADLQKPPLARVGVMDLETFFPAADRFALALAINNLLAAPGFDVWLRGDALALDSLLYTSEGKPRLAVISLAHLSDAERMFFVALLLNETIAWMRSKSGTASLRALLYMDEVFGYLPPVANPPSKKPMLVLLKQARAFGLGIVLATQNPVDLDYKALSNIGTWFLGRLQTERDKARVLDGLEGASTAAGETFDRSAIDKLLSGLRARVFLLHNVHEEAPVLLETRWAMSYLAGPLDREQLRALATSSQEPISKRDTKTPIEEGTSPASAPASPGKALEQAPVLPPKIQQVFLPFSGSLSTFVYQPALLGLGRAFVEDARLGVSERVDLALMAKLDDAGSVDWTTAEAVTVEESALLDRPASGASFASLPPRAARAESYAKWEKDLGAALARSATVTLLRSAALGAVSHAGENELDFRIRLRELAHERRDLEVAKVREKCGAKVATLEDRIRRAEARVEAEKQQADAQKLSTILAGAASVAGMFFGRRKLSATNVTRVGTAVRSLGRTTKESGDVERASESVEALREQKAQLESEIADAASALDARFDPLTAVLESVTVRPRKGDVEVRRLVLAWVPAKA
jgi:hypothetical protein